MTFGLRRYNMSDGGKGSKTRPTDKKRFDDNYDLIWGNKNKKKDQKDEKTTNSPTGPSS